MKKTDVVVIGSGIAGITASIYLRRANVDFVLLEGTAPGGKLNQLKNIENYPGYSSISGTELQLKLLDQLKSLDIKITYGKVQNILKEQSGFEVITDVDSFETKAVIVACGLSTKSEMIKGEKEYFGRGVSYCATCDGNFFKNQDVAVIGNNNIVLEESLYLSGLARTVYIFVPDKKIQGDELLVNRIKNQQNIKVFEDEIVSEIHGDEFGVTSIETNSREIGVSGVFPYTGKKVATEFLNSLNPEIHKFAVVVDDHMESSIKGLFAAGDIVEKQLRQIVTAANDGAIAATNAIILVKQIHL